MMNIVKPTLLVDTKRVRQNIERMFQKALKNDVRFRPHFKTHQSAEIGKWFHDIGVNQITVSSADMALFFAQYGWEDITIAFSVNVREIEKLNALARSITLHLLVESEETLDALQCQLQSPVHLWIKLDVGCHRTGLPWNDVEAIRRLAERIHHSDGLTLCGLLTHAGQTYQLRSQAAVRQVYAETLAHLKGIQQHLLDQGFQNIEISFGDTPCCSIIDDFSGLDEIRPGNFVFYDAMQRAIGSCTEEEIAVVVACPVIAKHPERLEIVMYGGAVHLSKEVIAAEVGHFGEVPLYGYVAQCHKDGWGPIVDKTYVARLSQEHGIIKTNQEFFQQVQIGDLLAVLPVHSCLTANLFSTYHTLEGGTIGILCDGTKVEQDWTF